MLKLGSIVFQDYEVPAAINFGGRQSIVNHRLASGVRVLDVLGPDSDKITFSGTFSGSSALARAKALDFLRKKGANTVLLWDDLSYEVVVSALSADFMNKLWIPYKCTCVVINTVPANRGAGSAGSNIAPLSTSMLASVSSLIQALPELAGLTVTVGHPGNTQESLNDVSLAQTSVNTGLVAAAQELTANLNLSPQSTLTAITYLANLQAAAESMSMLIMARSYLYAAQYEGAAS